MPLRVVFEGEKNCSFFTRNRFFLFSLARGTPATEDGRRDAFLGRRGGPAQRAAGKRERGKKALERELAFRLKLARMCRSPIENLATVLAPRSGADPLVQLH